MNRFSGKLENIALHLTSLFLGSDLKTNLFRQQQTVILSSVQYSVLFQ